MAIENVQLVNDRFPKHLGIGTTRTKEDRETEEEDKQKRVKIGRKMGTKYSSSKA